MSARPAHQPPRIALVFGGPSPEYNISLGSLKPWVTYLSGSPAVETTVVFLTRELSAHVLEERFCYANTCEDFLARLADRTPLAPAALDDLLSSQDLVVPLIHGEFGEDGQLQRRLEALGVRYLFSGPEAMERSIDKAECHRLLGAAGLCVPRCLELEQESWSDDRAGLLAKVRAFAAETPARADGAQVAIKPARGGSSFGVSLYPPPGLWPDGDREARLIEGLERAFALDERILVEGILSGPEFSVVVLTDAAGRAVPLCPTEIEARRSFFDERAKYLEGEDALFHTPFRQTEQVEPIRTAARAAFEALGMRHMARIDGFLVDGRVVVTDVNGISGFGFSSFVFQQSQMVGLGHAELIETLLRRALPNPDSLGRLLPSADLSGQNQRLDVLFGGPTSERHVSRKSGVFAGLCLQSRGFDVRFVLVDLESKLTPVGPYYALLHSVDEIHTLVRSDSARRELEATAQRIGAELGRDPRRIQSALAVGASTDLAGAVHGTSAVFLGLHGGAGEDGRMQAALELMGLPYNGPGPRASFLCADKARTAATVAAAQLPGVRASRFLVVELAELQAAALSRAEAPFEALWQRARAACGAAQALVIKPAADGCSTGVKLLENAAQLSAFGAAVVGLRAELPPGPVWNSPKGASAGQPWRIVRLPQPAAERWMLEEAFRDAGPPLPRAWTAAAIREWATQRRFLELTGAVLSLPDGQLAAATPSITLTAGEVLSLEEKFQQGMGTNLSLDLALDEATTQSVRQRIEAIAGALEIEGYARIDCFYDQQEDLLILLEANTLCGLTEATVFYSQVLDWLELSPPEVLERLIRHRMPAAD